VKAKMLFVNGIEKKRKKKKKRDCMLCVCDLRQQEQNSTNVIGILMQTHLEDSFDESFDAVDVHVVSNCMVEEIQENGLFGRVSNVLGQEFLIERSIETVRNRMSRTHDVVEKLQCLHSFVECRNVHQLKQSINLLGVSVPFQKKKKQLISLYYFLFLLSYRSSLNLANGKARLTPVRIASRSLDSISSLARISLKKPK
jgi:hypothetical protein